MASQAVFQGLVLDEDERPVTVSFVGGDAHYVIDDQGFQRHIDAESVDRQVLSIFIEQLQGNKDFAVSQALDFMGQDDLMTKAALDASVDQVDIDQIMKQGIPAQARQMLTTLGFRIIINYHGEVVNMHQPDIPLDE